MEENKQKRLFRWISENLKTWCIICGIDKEEISKEQYINIKAELKKEGFNEWVWVLYTCQNSAATIDIDLEVKEEHNNIARFIDENTELWLTICGYGEYPVSLDKYKEIMLLLQDNKFEELKIVLFSIHGYAVRGQYLETIKRIQKQCEREIEKRNMKDET